MSPASVPPLAGGGRKVSARTPDGSGTAPMRMSPNRGSSCWFAGGADRLSAVGNQGQIDVGDTLPERRGLLDLVLPGRRRVVRVQRLEERARDAADAGAVGHETVGDPAVVGPLIAKVRVEQEPGFQPFNKRTDGTAPRLRRCRSIEFQLKLGHGFTPLSGEEDWRGDWSWRVFTWRKGGFILAVIVELRASGLVTPTCSPT